MSVRVAVVVFPGSNCDRDAAWAVQEALPGAEAHLVWHEERSLDGFDAIIIPGGFSYGDYLRCGAVARFAPIMRAVHQAAHLGVPVLGICNGFQILAEAGLVSGALLRNQSLRFQCELTECEVVSTDTPWTCALEVGQRITLPIAHGEGRYHIEPEQHTELVARGQVVLRYAPNNPNGSIDAIAGVSGPLRNVVGMMPHPERALYEWMGSADGRGILQSILTWSPTRAHETEGVLVAH